MNKITQIKYTWHEYEIFLNQLAENLKTILVGSKNPVLLSVGRGGMTACAGLSHILGIKDCHYLGIRSYVGTESKEMQIFAHPQYSTLGSHDLIVVVDDIVDTGNTFKAVHKILDKEIPQIQLGLTNLKYAALLLVNEITYREYSDNKNDVEKLRYSLEKKLECEGFDQPISVTTGNNRIHIVPNNTEQHNRTWYTFPWERGIE